MGRPACGYQGAKRALLTGVLVAAGSGLVYVLSFYFASQPKASVGILLLGPAVLGLGESFVITGALTLGLTLLDRRLGHTWSTFG